MADTECVGLGDHQYQNASHDKGASQVKHNPFAQNAKGRRSEMRRLHRCATIAFSLLLSAISYGQTWSGVLSSSRAINWSSAGLPATLPDGETTANPWTPPSRTQCGTTLSPSGDTSGVTDTTNINKGLAACTAGHYYLLASGQFYVNNVITMYQWSGVTLRGSGPQSTTMNLSSAGTIEIDWAMNGGNCTVWSSGFSAGTTSIGVSGCTGNSPQVGQVIQLTQCDTGTSGAGCATGTVADNGGLFVCGYNPVCIRSGEGTATGTHWQYQTAYITGASGSGGSYAINFTPGLFLSNWSSASGPTVSWLAGNNPAHAPYGDGIEDMTITGSTSIGPLIRLSAAYASWAKGVRVIGGVNGVLMNNSTNCLIINSYFYRETPPPGSGYGAAVSQSQSSNNLILNNFFDIDTPWEGFGSDSGNVIAYNYTRDNFTAYVLAFFEHQGGSHMELFEGNQTSQFQEDDTHGTHDLNSWFRNYSSCYDAPYSPVNAACFMWDDFSRFENAIGNVFAAPAAGLITTYAGSGDSGWVYRLGQGQFNDALVKPTSMRWGNWDSVTNAVRWCGNSSSPGWSTICNSASEVPSSLASPNAAFSNPVPSTTALPPSFFLPTAAAPNGGTGLSWWKVCTTWTTFPATCGSTQTQPFPPIGPDVTGGAYGGGHAYDIPAKIAWQNLPVDPNYQTSYTITGSSWSGGTETLTLNNPPNLEHLMGAFQLSGVQSGCRLGASFNSNNEILITSSTSTTVSYALPSNPGVSCTGSFLFPDVRQFDERVYLTDSATVSLAPVTPPTGLSAAAK